MSEFKEPLAPRIFLGLGLVMVGALAYFVAPDFSYYLQPAALRPLHPHHEFLRSSGRGGLTFGIIGMCLILLNLSYLVRKRLLFIEWLGSLRSWMAFHVFTGLTAGALVLLHSAFRPQSALGILGFGSISIVVITGLIGRYIYARTPRSLEGRELELDEIRRRLEGYQAGLSKLGMPQDFFKKSLSPVVVHGTDSGLFAALWGLLAGDRELHREYEELRHYVRQSPVLQPLAREVLPLALRFAKERQWMIRYNEMRSLMSGWRFLHRWLAILLVVAVAFHIYVALRMGNLWILNYLR